MSPEPSLGKEVIAMTNSQQAWENREYVRRLLKERQPEFAAALELAERELRLQDRLELLRSASAVPMDETLQLGSWSRMTVHPTSPAGRPGGST
jgi:hypothetical protein